MPRIAFWETVGEAYRFVFSDGRRFLRAAGAWIMVWLLAEAVTLLLARGYIEFLRFDAAANSGSFGASLVLAVLNLPWFAVTLVGPAAFAVAWQRSVLLGETAPTAIAALRFGRREWRFLGYSIALLVVPLLAVAAALMPIEGIVAVLFDLSGHRLAPGVWPLHGAALVASISGAGAAILFLWVRLGLVWPALALDEGGTILRRSWRNARGYGWFLFAGFFACNGPFLVALVLVEIARHHFLTALRDPTDWHPLSWLGFFLVVAAGISIQFLAMAVGFGFVAQCYRQLASTEPHTVTGTKTDNGS